MWLPRLSLSLLLQWHWLGLYPLIKYWSNCILYQTILWKLIYPSIARPEKCLSNMLYLYPTACEPQLSHLRWAPNTLQVAPVWQHHGNTTFTQVIYDLFHCHRAGEKNQRFIKLYQPMSLACSWEKSLLAFIIPVHSAVKKQAVVVIIITIVIITMDIWRA